MTDQIPDSAATRPSLRLAKGRSKRLRDNFHWHTGTPIESDAWTSTEDKTRAMLEVYRKMPLEELAKVKCALLTRGGQAFLRSALSATEHLFSPKDKASRLLLIKNRVHVMVRGWGGGRPALRLFG